MYKQIIVIRNDLNMGKGKLIAQGAHASLGAYKKTKNSNPDITTAWEIEGQMKIALKVNSEQELIEYFQKTRDAKIPCILIKDAGHTQLNPGTITCFAAGPWKEKELDGLFSGLKLL